MNNNTITKKIEHLNARGECILHISHCTGKLDGFDAINTDLNCKECNDLCALRSVCYAEGFLNYRKGLKEWFEYNSKLLRESILNDTQLPQINARMFRFNSFGGVDNEIQVINFFKIAVFNPFTTFALWTKNIKAVADAVAQMGKPENIIIVYSSPKLDQAVKIERLHEVGYTFIDKVFTVYTFGYLKDHPEIKINCGGLSCMGCQRCYNLQNTETEVNEVVKDDARKYYKHVLQSAGFQCNSLSLEQMHNIYKMITK